MDSNKSKMRCKRGFTLIELLVVVLIIGILAAVAVPQYQKAVEKSRTAEAWTTMKSIQNAAEIYEMEQGVTGGTINWEDLSLQFTNANGTAVTGDTAASTFNAGKWQYFRYPDGCVEAVSMKGDWYVLKLTAEGERLCQGNQSYCNKAGAKTASTVVCDGHMITSGDCYSF